MERICVDTRTEFALALGGILTYHVFVMRLNILLIVSLLLIVIAAPIVDALACDDCKDFIPLRDMQQRPAKDTDHSDGDPLSSSDGHPAPEETGTAQDLCPICANTAAAMSNSCCGAPSMISNTNNLPKLIAFSDPSYSITKPPQN